MKRIYLLNDYLTSKNTLKNIEQWLNQKYQNTEIISMDYTEYFNQTEVEEIDLNSVLDFFINELKTKVENDDILVAIGTSCRILSSFEENKKILINPLMFNNLINVFTTPKKYFENKLDQFKIYLDKLIDTNNYDIESEYKWYSDNYDKIVKLTEKINLYETLKSLINSDISLFKDSYVILTEMNQILDNEITLKYLMKKLSKKVKFETEINLNSKHLEFNK